MPEDSRLARLEAAARDVLGKMRPAVGRTAYREIHSRHLRQLEAALAVQPTETKEQPDD